MGVSKVIVNGVTYVDMTSDTATAATIVSPETAHTADGEQTQGTYVAPSSVTQATPTISVNTSTGLITASSTQSAGLVSAGTKTATEQLPVKTSSDMTVSGATVTAPAGYYTSAQSKNVASGSATTPATTITANPSVSIDSDGLVTATASASKSITPTVSAGYVSAGTAGTVTVSGSGTMQLTKRTSTDLTASGATVTAPAGYYPSSATKSVASGTAGTPTATKGTVSGHAISVTPSVTNATGYITGGTKTGTAVSVSASELVSGTKTITANGVGIDVTNYADVTVSVSAPTPTLQTKSVSYTPTESAQSATVTCDAGYDGLDEVNISVGAISSTYVGSGITQRSSSDLTASGATVTAPSGYYANSASKAVSNGSATTPATTITANPSISVSNSGLITATASATKSVTPAVSAGYVSSGTAGTITVSGSNTSQLTTQGAQTIHPSTTDQTIASGRYLTGTQTIAAVTTTNLTAANIVSGVTVKVGDASDDDCVASVTGTASGGGSNYTLLATHDFTVNTTSTSAGSVGTVSVGSDALTTAKVIYVKIRDKAGPRAGYFLGSDCYFYNATLANGAYGSALTTMGRLIHRYTSTSQYAVYVGATTTGYGVYGYSVSTGGAINIYRRYSSSYSLTINSVYNVEVYALDYAPNTGNPYNYTFTPDVHGTGILSNMIEDGNFANTTWWGAYNVAYSVSSNTGDVYANGASKAYPQLTRDYMLVVPNHVYYIRADMKYDWSDPTPPPHPGEISFHTTDWATFLNVQYDASNAGTWQTLSTLGTYSTTIGNFNLALPYDTNTTYGYQNLHVYFKNVMFVDLTEGYDYGNEPTKAWCDANLPYFQGTYTIPT